jgi:hypothetical protein
MYLLEMIYTNKIKILSTDDSKIIIENPDILQSLNSNLNEILVMLKDNIIDNMSSKYLIELIYSYLDKIREYICKFNSNKEFEKILIYKKFSDTTSFISKNMLPSDLSSHSRIRNNNLEDEGEDNDGNFNQRGDYFQQFSKGTKINLLSNNDVDLESERNTINFIEFIKIQKELLENTNQLDFKITEIQKKLNYSLCTSIKTSIPESLAVKIYIGETLDSDLSLANIYNKLSLVIKSTYFSNLIKTNYNSKEINLKNINNLFSKKTVQNILKFLHDGKLEFNLEEIFEMLEISSYLMIDNINFLLEVELEQLIGIYYLINKFRSK